MNWRAVPAADGHDTTGFLTFGVRSVSLLGPTQSVVGGVLGISLLIGGTPR